MMINYLIEFALIHLVLFGVYKLLLSKETQLAYLRLYLLASSILALLVPLISLPNYSPVTEINITGTVSAIILPELLVGEQPIEHAWYTGISWFSWLLLSVSIVLSIRFIVALAQILIAYRKSKQVNMFGHNIRHLPELESSFTFFSWIFIDQYNVDDARSIIRHEEAHIKSGHSYDLILMNLLTIPFWWVPSIWLTIRELKQIHEYQADAYSLGTIKYENYLNTLINHSLKKEGLILTNSFNDTPLTKRLKYMKQLKKKINPWKITGIMVILFLTVYTFSCQELGNNELNQQVTETKITQADEIFMIVDEPASYHGDINEYYNYVQNELKYPEEAVKKGVEGKVFIEFIINKDGTVSDVTALKGIGFGCDKEAIRVVENSPTWTPGKQKGRTVRTRLVLPITFKLSGNSEYIGEENDINFSIPENAATYPGGFGEFFTYLKENIKYPEKAKELGVRGVVNLEFTVGKDGNISSAKVLKGIGYGCDEEALRLIKNSPTWTPGKTGDGALIESTFKIPILFSNL